MTCIAVVEVFACNVKDVSIGFHNCKSEMFELLLQQQRYKGTQMRAYIHTKKQSNAQQQNKNSMCIQTNKLQKTQLQTHDKCARACTCHAAVGVFGTEGKGAVEDVTCDV